MRRRGIRCRLLVIDYGLFDFMLRYFYNNDKVNYVDDSNRFAGFDMGRHCCESFGHGVYGLNGEKLSPNDDNVWLCLSFAECPPIEDDGTEFAMLTGDDDLRCGDCGGMVRLSWWMSAACIRHGWRFITSIMGIIRTWASII